MEDKNLYLIGAVQKTGKSLHVLAASAKQAAKYAKMYRRGQMELYRQDRANMLRIEIQEYLTKHEPETLCFGCDLENTFCEGARCEYQEEVFYEQPRGRKYWKKLIFEVMGKDYYNLSLGSKLELLKDLV